MFDGRYANCLKTSVQFFELSLHGENLLAGRGNRRLGVGDAEGTQKPIRASRATADRAFDLALTERRVDHADSLQRLQGLLRRKVRTHGLKLALQGSRQQQGESGHEEMGLYPMISSVIDGAHLQDVLELPEATLHIAQILIDLHRFNCR